MSPVGSRSQLGADLPEAKRPAATEPPRATDWVVRLYESAPFGPLAVGALLAAAHLGVSLVGRTALATPSPMWIALDVLNAALFAFVPTAVVILRHRAVGDLVALRPLLRADAPPFDEVVRRALAVSPRWLALSGLVFALAFASMPILDPRFWGETPPSLAPPALVAFFAIRSALSGWLIGHAVATELWLTAAYYLLGTNRLRVDLDHLDALAPLARRGLRSAFTWITCVSLVSLFWLSPAAGSSNGLIIAIALLLVGGQAVASVAGARANVRAAKRARLAEIDDRIGREADRVLRPDDSSPVDARLANLVAYRGFVERLPEWPLAGPAAWRFLLIALLGVGSWLGGALVERALDALLG